MRLSLEDTPNNMKTKLPEYLKGYSLDKRKRRNQHRRNARHILQSGGFFDNFASHGSTLWCIAQWHLNQARYLGR